jgi:hypothetical protein
MSRVSMGLPVGTVVAVGGYGRHQRRVRLLFAVLMVSAAGDEIAVLTMIFFGNSLD